MDKSYEFNYKAHTLLQHKMFRTIWDDMGFEFSIDAPVNICCDEKNISLKYDKNSVLYVKNRYGKYGEKFYILEDVDMKVVPYRFKEDDVFLASRLRNPKIIDCDIVNFRISDSGLDEYRVRWKGMKKKKHDTWVSKEQYEYLIYDKHRRFGLSLCNCPNIKKISPEYSDPETKKKNKNSIWLHRNNKLPCRKNSQGILVHYSNECCKKYKAKKAHVLSIKTPMRLYKV